MWSSVDFENEIELLRYIKSITIKYEMLRLISMLSGKFS